MTDFRYRIPWPNHEGYTPCSGTYARTLARRDAIWTLEDGGSLEDLSPEDYQAWMQADHELLSLQASREHLGKSVRF